MWYNNNDIISKKVRGEESEKGNTPWVEAYHS